MLCIEANSSFLRAGASPYILLTWSTTSLLPALSHPLIVTVRLLPRSSVTLLCCSSLSLSLESTAAQSHCALPHHLPWPSRRSTGTTQTWNAVPRNWGVLLSTADLGLHTNPLSGAVLWFNRHGRAGPVNNLFSYCKKPPMWKGCWVGNFPLV